MVCHVTMNGIESMSISVDLHTHLRYSSLPEVYTANILNVSMAGLTSSSTEHRSMLNSMYSFNSLGNL